MHFAFDLGQSKTQLADSIGAYAQQYLDALPSCTNGEVPDPTQPLKATCKPAGYDSAAAAAKIKQDLLANEQFLPADKLNADGIQTDSGQSLAQNLSAVPAVYEQVRWGTYISGAVALLSAIGVLTCTSTWLAGLKRFGIITVIVGAVSALAAWAVGAVLGNVGTHLATETTAALQSSLVKAVTLVTQDVRNWWLGYGIVLAVVGAASLVLRMILAKRAVAPQETPAAVGAATPLAGVTPVSGIEVTASKPISSERNTRPRFRKIQ